MTQTIWRIATDTPTYEADDLSGEGAKAKGGRWNTAGSPMVYGSQTRAMACLETIVHLNAGDLPLNRYLVAITIPNEIWRAARRETEDTLDTGWNAEPAGRVSIRFGTKWLASAATAILIVPSVIVPEEFNVLLNPLHVDSKALSAKKVRKWTYDPRLLKRTWQ